MPPLSSLVTASLVSKMLLNPKLLKKSLCEMYPPKIKKKAEKTNTTSSNLSREALHWLVSLSAVSRPHGLQIRNPMSGHHRAPRVVLGYLEQEARKQPPAALPRIQVGESGKPEDLRMLCQDLASTDTWKAPNSNLMRHFKIQGGPCL